MERVDRKTKSDRMHEAFLSSPHILTGKAYLRDEARHSPARKHQHRTTHIRKPNQNQWNDNRHPHSPIINRGKGNFKYRPPSRDKSERRRTLISDNESTISAPPLTYRMNPTDEREDYSRLRYADRPHSIVINNPESRYSDTNSESVSLSPMADDRYRTDENNTNDMHWRDTFNNRRYHYRNGQKCIDGKSMTYSPTNHYPYQCYPESQQSDRDHNGTELPRWSSALLRQKYRYHPETPPPAATPSVWASDDESTAPTQIFPYYVAPNQSSDLPSHLANTNANEKKPEKKKRHKKRRKDRVSPAKDKHLTPPSFTTEEGPMDRPNHSFQIVDCSKDCSNLPPLPPPVSRPSFGSDDKHCYCSSENREPNPSQRNKIESPVSLIKTSVIHHTHSQSKPKHCRPETPSTSSDSDTRESENEEKASVLSDTQWFKPTPQCNTDRRHAYMARNQSRLIQMPIEIIAYVFHWLLPFEIWKLCAVHPEMDWNNDAIIEGTDQIWFDLIARDFPLSQTKVIPASETSDTISNEEHNSGTEILSLMNDNITWLRLFQTYGKSTRFAYFTLSQLRYSDYCRLFWDERTLKQKRKLWRRKRAKHPNSEKYKGDPPRLPTMPSKEDMHQFTNHCSHCKWYQRLTDPNGAICHFFIHGDIDRFNPWHNSVYHLRLERWKAKFGNCCWHSDDIYVKQWKLELPPLFETIAAVRVSMTMDRPQETVLRYWQNSSRHDAFWATVKRLDANVNSNSRNMKRTKQVWNKDRLRTHNAIVTALRRVRSLLIVVKCTQLYDLNQLHKC